MVKFEPTNLTDSESAILVPTPDFMTEYLSRFAIQRPPIQGPLAWNQYRCAQCGNIYDKGWDDVEAQAEAKKLFGIVNVSDPNVAVICDDCFNEV